MRQKTRSLANNTRKSDLLVSLSRTRSGRELLRHSTRNDYSSLRWHKRFRRLSYRVRRKVLSKSLPIARVRDGSKFYLPTRIIRSRSKVRVNLVRQRKIRRRVILRKPKYKSDLGKWRQSLVGRRRDHHSRSARQRRSWSQVTTALTKTARRVKQLTQAVAYVKPKRERRRQ